MNDEQMQSALDEWLEDTDPQPPSARRTATNVMAHVPQTRQRGRWLPFRLFSPKAQTPTATDTAEYQPIPIPASNGHTPTVIGRTQSMLSPAKAITAGALVFALGGAFLVAQPFQQESGVPGAEAERAPSVPVTGTSNIFATCSMSVVAGEVEIANEERKRFTCSSFPWSMSDPRLEGTVLRISEANIVTGPRAEAFAAACAEDEDGCEEVAVDTQLRAISIENDAGAWRERPRFYSVFPGSEFEWPFHETWTTVLDGGGDYDGLVAVLQVTHSSDTGETYTGYIIDADSLPPAPENASAK